ncbi:hypothetical protein [Cytobacillus sp. IB215665]|uniref:hypothetical protein n=1 Tax=Cytobacillus sp. IB215665 TaxID=3097357 RepID=UPI002A0DEB84|nr:hypothetical protein [Cytobacillus sp. IB215665]MDX8367681.1 hypothetical protein [Cytobacillus sp. IB215665]
MTDIKIKTMEDAVALAIEIGRTEAALKQMKEQLKAFAKNNGTVNTGEVLWDFQPSVSWKIAPESLRKLTLDLAIEGVDPWELLQISKKNLDGLGWSEDVLEQYGQKSVKKTFRSVKASPQTIAG